MRCIIRTVCQIHEMVSEAIRCVLDLEVDSINPQDLHEIIYNITKIRALLITWLGETL